MNDQPYKVVKIYVHKNSKNNSKVLTLSVKHKEKMVVFNLKSLLCFS